MTDQLRKLAVQGTHYYLGMAEDMMKEIVDAAEEAQADIYNLAADCAAMKAQIEGLTADGMAKAASPPRPKLFAISKEGDVSDAVFPKPPERRWDWRAGRYV